jgi:hypothetical protein
MGDYRNDHENNQGRRNFLKISGTVVLSLPFKSFPNFANPKVAFVSEPRDLIANSKPAKWAAQYFEQALLNAGITVKKYDTLSDIAGSDLAIVIAGPDSVSGKSLMKNSSLVVYQTAESLALIPVKSAASETILVHGQDERGLVYALLELADRVLQADQPLTALKLNQPVVEKPANSIRSLNRLFVSDVEDKPWYNDKEMWPQYLTMLATQRFNRFNLSFGIGYDFLQKVTDAYFFLPILFYLKCQVIMFVFHNFLMLKEILILPCFNL